jgi:putative membrane protein
MRTRQWVQSVLLLSLGLYFLDNMLTGRIFYYINERFGWLSWIATGIFLAMGVVGIADLLRERRAKPHDDHDHAAHEPHEHDEHDHHDHAEHDHLHDHDPHAGHQHGAAPSWPILALVGLPLILGLVVPAKPLGASAVGSSGVSTSFSAVQGSGSTTQLNVAPTDRNVLDWVRAFNGTSNVQEFNAQQADLVGFVYRDVRFKDDAHFMAARFTISCCVADATAIGVIVQAPNAAKLDQDSWVHVKGKFQVQDFDGQQTPILVAETVEPTNQPEHPYLYP